MTSLWVVPLGLGLAGVLVLDLLSWGPMNTRILGSSLVGIWREDRPSPPRKGRHISGATLRLRDDGRFSLTGYHTTVYGTWRVAWPGVMRWNGKQQGWIRLPVAWKYALDGDTLTLESEARARAVRWYRITELQ